MTTATKAANGRIAAPTLAFRCNLVMLRRLRTSWRLVHTQIATISVPNLVGFPQMELAERPWNALPPATAEALRPELPGLVEEIIEAISHVVPDYARPLEGPFGQAL